MQNFYGRAGKLGLNFYNFLCAPANESGGEGGGSGTAANGNEGGNSNSGSGGQPADKGFTQADVDRIVQDRIARVSAKKDQEWQQKLEGLDPTELEEFKQFKTNREKAVAEEMAKNKKFEEVINKINANHTKEKEALSAEKTQLQRLLEGNVAKNALFSTLSKHKLVERAPEQIAGLIKNKLRVKNVETGEVEVVGPDGAFLADNRGVPYNLETFVDAWLSENPHFLAGSGGGAGYRPPGGSKQTFTRRQLTDPAFYKANREAILLAQKEGRIVNE